MFFFFSDEEGDAQTGPTFLGSQMKVTNEDGGMAAWLEKRKETPKREATSTTTDQEREEDETGEELGDLEEEFGVI